jgi:hypothetical protein
VLSLEPLPNSPLHRLELFGPTRDLGAVSRGALLLVSPENKSCQQYHVLARVDHIENFPDGTSKCHARVCLPKRSAYNDYIFQYHPPDSAVRFELMAAELEGAATASQVAIQRAGQGVVHREPARFCATVIGSGVITDLRKFVALHLLQSCELLRDLLATTSRPHVPPSDLLAASAATWNRLPTLFGNQMTLSLNGGQLAALQFAMATTGGFTLLQGPPVTTRTAMTP